MQRDPRHYADAARLLWDMPPERLANLASGELTAAQGVRDAAQMALGVKREFLSPEDFGSERSALERLAAGLAVLPDFSLQEIAIASGRGPIQRPQQTPDAPARKRSRSRMLRVIVIALILLLGLEALAQAGVDVISPIGVIVDQLDGEADPDELRERVDPEAAGSWRNEPNLLPAPARNAPRADTRGRRETKTVAKEKQVNHARGRRAHAQGRGQHHAQGRYRRGRAQSENVASSVATRANRVLRRATSNSRRVVESRRPWQSRGRGRSR